MENQTLNSARPLVIHVSVGGGSAAEPIDVRRGEMDIGLQFAAKTGNLVRVQELSQWALDVEKVDALMAAAGQDQLEIVRYFVGECSVDVNGRDTYERTALMSAASGGHIEIVRYLAEQGGANVNATGNYGRTALMSAARNDHIGVVRYLAEECMADVNAKDNDGWTVMIRAASDGHIDFVRYLVEQCSADVNAKDANGRTAMMVAAFNGNIRVVQYFVEQYSVDVNAKRKDGWTALMSATVNGHIDVVRYLAEQCSAYANAEGKDGRTALMSAARNGHIEIVRYLVEAYGADVYGRDEDGETATMSAAKRGHIDVVRYLAEQCSADVNVTNNEGMSAVRIAADRGYHEIQRILTPYLQPARHLSIGTADTANDAATISAKDEAIRSISPSEIELLHFAHNGHIGGDFRAKWLDSDVVVKLFVADAAQAPFEDEVHLWQQLRHPNVVKIYGACDAGPLLKLFVCEYASKGSLQELVTTASSVEKPAIWKFLYNAALGLECLHERGIVHGNLRCSNILIGDDGVAKLSNFGRSGLKDRFNEDAVVNDVVASIRWQAPEVLERNPLSYESDVYSLGMCIVEATTGRAPWGDEGEVVITHNKMGWYPEVIHQGNDRYMPRHIPDNVRDLVLRMCCRDPHKRASLSSIVKELERLAAQESSNSSQLEHEPASTFDEYKCGKLTRAWEALQTCMKTCEDFQYRQAFDDIRNVHDHLQDSVHDPTLLARFLVVLTEFYQMVKMPPEQARILRLSSTRATTTSLYAMQWRINALLTSMGGETDTVLEREVQWQQQCTKRSRLFVSGVSDIHLLLQDLKSVEERSAFLKTLTAEMTEPLGKYTPDQLSAMQKTYESLANVLEKEGDLSELTSPWFIPWYQLVVDEWSCLGTGGFGSVHQAKWLDSDVVVKRVTLPGSDGNVNTSMFDMSQSILSASFRPDPTATQAQKNSAKRVEAVAMFRREVDIWFGFNHPHAVRLFGACHVGRPFFVCEFAPNGTLVSYLRKHPDELWPKLYEAALGVQYLHARNVVHGDLKGNNIVIGSDLKAKVTDFGLSSFADGEAESKISAAWHWVAPECLRDANTRPTPASDVYSLGMCIVEALRVVDAVRSGNNTQLCYPWRDQPNSTVKYHATRGTLPSRPTICEDHQWELIERLCVLDPKKRMKISTVVDELARLGLKTNSDKQEDDLADVDAATSCTSLVDFEAASDVISVARKLLHLLKGDANQDEEVIRLYASLWDYFEHVCGQIDREKLGVECITAFCSLIADANASTVKLEHANTSLVSLAEWTMRCYALRRRLDKLCDAYFIVCEVEDLGIDSVAMTVSIK